MTISNTATTAERGLWVLRCLKSSGINTLKEINLSSGKQVPLDIGHPDHKKDVNNEWFGGEQEPVNLLVSTLQRQTSLEKLTMKFCALTDDQKSQIRKAVSGRDVEIDFGDEKPAPSRVIPMAVTAAVGAVAAAAYFFMKKKN